MNDVLENELQCTICSEHFIEVKINIIVLFKGENFGAKYRFVLLIFMKTMRGD